MNAQRPPAELRYADELARLREHDTDDRPPGWALSLRAARRFVLGDETLGVSRKFVGDPSLIDRSLVALATNRGLMLVGVALRLLRIKQLPVGDLLPGLVIAPLLTAAVVALR